MTDPLDLATHIFLPCEYSFVKNPAPREKDRVRRAFAQVTGTDPDLREIVVCPLLAQRVRRGRNPLAFASLLTVDSHAQHLTMLRHLRDTRRPAIVIAASGMCAGGRIVDYLKAMLGDPRHNVLFVGHQAQGTPGRAIQKYGPRGGYVDLDGERIVIRAGIETLGGYSAHADRRGLLGFATRMRHWPREIRLVHGEAQARQHLAEALRARYAQRGLPLVVR